MAESVVISSMLLLRANPSMEFLDILMSKRSIGIMIGKPRIAMSVPLFEAFDAILEIIVKVVEKPIDPKSRLTKNSQIS